MDNENTGDLNGLRKTPRVLRRRMIGQERESPRDKAGQVNSNGRRPLFVRVPQAKKTTRVERIPGRGVTTPSRDVGGARDRIRETIEGMNVLGSGFDNAYTETPNFGESFEIPQLDTPITLEANIERIKNINERIAGFDDEMRNLRTRLNMPAEVQVYSTSGPGEGGPGGAGDISSRMREMEKNLADPEISTASIQSSENKADPKEAKVLAAPSWAVEKVRRWKEAGKP